ncbi:protein 5NUC-like isoform X2 [Ornithodoros turicata]|uniref:protein 5NUC-like isoform X2 n=1 Tax=Ornithodoros turicata TaxID=34597 RepID=UPI00313A1BAC
MLFLLLSWSSFLLTDVASLNLTVLHTNDIHAHFVQTNRRGTRCRPENKEKCVGGVARQLYVRKFREELSNVLYLNAGDNYQGTAWYSILKYKPVAEVMEILRPNAMTLGAHEFDDGPKGLAPFLSAMRDKVPVVCCNVNFSLSPELKHLQVSKSVVLKVANTAVGVIGVITAETNLISEPAPVFFEDDFECIRQEARRLRNTGVKVLIALTQVGYQEDLRLASNISEISLVVGGHSHTFLYTGTKHPDEDIPQGPYPTVVSRTDGTNALVVTAFRYGKYLGHIDLLYDDKGDLKSWSGAPIFLDGSITEDKQMLELLQTYQGNVTAASKAVIGYSKVLLIADNYVCQLQECNLGNFIADALFNYFAEKPLQTGGSWSMINGCILDSGNIKGSLLPESDILREDLLETIPFDNTLFIATLTGQHLRKVFEHSARKYPLNGENPSSAFLQVSGIRVTYNMTKPADQRVHSLAILCTNCTVPHFELVEDNTMYNIAVPSFIAKGGYGYNFTGATLADTGTVVLEAVERYFAKMSPVKAGIEKRITILRAAKIRPYRSDAASLQKLRLRSGITYLLPCMVPTVYTFTMIISLASYPT